MWLKTRFLEVAKEVRTSYWFVPSLLALAGFAAGLGLVWLDAVLGDAWLGRFEWFYGSRPEGARALLSTVAGSTITVAGVVFSVTLAAVTYASGQYGPRLLSTFTSDRGNQVSLGVFIGTFLYCLVVLRTIRSTARLRLPSVDLAAGEGAVVAQLRKLAAVPALHGKPDQGMGAPVGNRARAPEDARLAPGWRVP